tara:strand:+ start:3545 stop:3916 length:372 start_codon:yes stop_codon:yes gene_type:complete
MAMQNKTEHAKKRMLKALEVSYGVVSHALKAAKVGRTTFYDWLKSDAEFKQKVEECESIALDMAESQLYTQIESGNTVATIFYLKTKGKKRGYVERQELAGVEDQPVTFRVNITPPSGSNDDS